jgi:hypothetical protein
MLPVLPLWDDLFQVLSMIVTSGVLLSVTFREVSRWNCARNAELLVGP